MKNYFYFAYGSNLDPKQIDSRCPGARMIGRASLADHTLCFPRRSNNRNCAVAGYKKSPGNTLYGVVYELDEAALAALDESEGYKHGRDPNSNAYNRVEIEVTLDGRSFRCLTYQAIPQQSPGKPNKEYIGLIVSGARARDLPQCYIKWLETIETSG